jgi:peptide deformylase
MQHEYDHLNGTLYVDRLDERQSKKAKKAVRRNGWGKPGFTWLPGVDPDPFGHDEDDEHDGHDHAGHEHDHAGHGHDDHDHDHAGHGHPHDHAHSEGM